MRKYIPAILLYLLINVLFVDKYSMRITEWHYAIDALYLLIGSGLIIGLNYLRPREIVSKVLLWSVGIAYSTLLIVLQYKIDPLSLQVDRWSAIHYFWDNMFRGVYPYSAQTHLGGYGSPFPVWQILHFPFYLIGNVGLSFFAALVFFLFVLTRSRSANFALLALLLIAASPAINYEIVVRSDLITNFILVCSLCEWLRFRSISIQNHTLLIAVITGLLASTRLAALIPLGMLYGYAFLQLDWKKQCVFLVTTVITFVLTFLPFILWDGNQLLFFEFNPFVLQTRQGSPAILVIFAAIAISWTYYKKNHLQHFNLYAGGLLTCLVLLTFTYNMVFSGNYDLFSPAYDITYFNMALPFYIYEIATTSTH